MPLILAENPEVSDEVKARFDWLNRVIEKEPSLVSLRDDLGDRVIKVCFHNKTSFLAPSFGAHIEYADDCYQRYDRISLLDDYDVIDKDEDDVGPDERERRVRLQTLSSLVFELCNAANQSLREVDNTLAEAEREAFLLDGRSEDEYAKHYADTNELAEHHSTHRHAEIVASLLASGTESDLFTMLDDEDKSDAATIVEKTRAMDDAEKILAFTKNCMQIEGTRSHHAYYEEHGRRLFQRSRVKLEAEGKLKREDLQKGDEDKIELVLVDADALDDVFKRDFNKMKWMLNTDPLFVDLRRDLAGRKIEVAFNANDDEHAPKFGMSLLYGGRRFAKYDRIFLLQNYEMLEHDEEASADAENAEYSHRDNFLYALDNLVLGLVMAADDKMRPADSQLTKEMIRHIKAGGTDEAFAMLYADRASTDYREAMLRHTQIKQNLLERMAAGELNTEIGSMLQEADLQDIRDDNASVLQTDTEEKQIEHSKEQKALVGDTDKSFHQTLYDSGLLLIRGAREQLEPEVTTQASGEYRDLVRQQAGARSGIALFENGSDSNKNAQGKATPTASTNPNDPGPTDTASKGLST